MHKKQWLIIVVGCVLAIVLFCLLGRFNFSPSTDIVHRTINPDKSVSVVETITGPKFYANKMGRALLGSFIVLGGTIFVVKRVGRSMSIKNSQPFINNSTDPGVWPPPLEAPQPTSHL